MNNFFPMFSQLIMVDKVGGGGGIGYQVSDITSTKCSFGYFSLDTPTPFAVLTVFLDNT